MSNYGPCVKCGEYVSVGPFEEIICSGCSNDDEPFLPDNNVSSYLSNNDVSRNDLVGKKVYHNIYGVGEIKRFSSSEVTVVFTNKNQNDEIEHLIDASHLKVKFSD